MTTSTRPRMTASWAAVWRPFAFGTEWVEAYGFRRAGLHNRLKGSVRVRSLPDRPHPQLVAPLALVRWGAGLHDSPASAALHVATRTLEESLADLPDTLALPARCEGAGRCEVTALGNQVLVTSEQDQAEAVARALIHPGACIIGAALRKDWIGLWPDHRLDLAVQSVITVERLRRDPSAAAVQAGRTDSESQLAKRWAEDSFQSMGRHNFGRYKSTNAHGYPVDCRHCGTEMYPRGRYLCPVCTRYPAGPRQRDSVLDRIERHLAVGR